MNVTCTLCPKLNHQLRFIKSSQHINLSNQEFKTFNKRLNYLFGFYLLDFAVILQGYYKSK